MAAATAVGAGAVQARADTFTWTKLSAGNASGSWNDPTNWNNGAGPVASGADNTADFTTLNITATSTVTLDGPQTIGNLSFGDTDTATAASWTISPGTPTTSTLGLITSSGQPTITVNTGVVARLNAGLTGSQAFNKAGAGTLQLGATAGANTFSGNLLISDGILRLGLNDQIPDNASIVMTGTGQFVGADTGGTGRTDTFANLTINSSGGNGFQAGATNSVITISGTTTVNGGTLTINSGGTAIVTNKLVMTGGATLFGANAGAAPKLTVGSGGLVLGNPTSGTTLTIGSTSTASAGGGWLALNGDVSVVYSSGIAAITTSAAASGGVLELGSAARQFYVENGANAIDLNITAIMGVNGTAGVSATGSGLVKTGGGLMQLSPAKPNQYTGQTTVNDGTLRLLTVAGANNTNPLDPSTPLTLGGAALVLQGPSTASTVSSQTFGGTFTLTTGGGAITLVPGAATNTASLTLPNTWNVASSGTSLYFDLSATGTSTVSSSPIAPNASPTPTSPIIPYATVRDGSGVGFAYVNGSGNIARYTAGTTIQTSTSGTTITLDPATNYTLDVNAALTLNAASSTTGNSLVLTNSTAASATLTLNGKTLATTTNAILANMPTADVVLANGQLGAADTELRIHKTGGSNLQLANNLSPTSGTGSITIDGDGQGIVVFNNPSATFSGGVRANVGAYIVPVVSSTASGGTVTSGPFGTGTVTFDGGTIRATSGTNIVIDNPVVLASDLIMPATSSNRSLTFAGPLTITGTSHLVSNPVSSPLLLSGIVSDGGNGLGLLKTGAGQVVLGGINTYTGPTSVYGGLLAVNGSIPGSVVVNSTGTLGGTGQIGGSVTVTGATSRLNPGTNTLPTTGSTAISTGPGILSIAGDLSLSSVSTYAVEIGGKTPGNASTNYDQTRVGGTAVLGGSTLSMTFAGYTPAEGDIYYLLTQEGPGSLDPFAGLPDGTFFNIGSVNMLITYHANWTGTQAGSSFTGGNDVAVQVVPEPAGATMLLMAAAGGLLSRRRRRL